MYVSMYLCMHVSMYVCIYVCMYYVCKYVYMYLYYTGVAIGGRVLCGLSVASVCFLVILFVVPLSVCETDACEELLTATDCETVDAEV